MPLKTTISRRQLLLSISRITAGAVLAAGGCAATQTPVYTGAPSPDPAQSASSAGSVTAAPAPALPAALTPKAYLPLTSTVDPKPSTDWYMAGANLQRTSWVPEGVSGNLGVEWYRPIDAYIPQHVQVIASNGLLYISTAKGLYALYANNGSTAWRFDTELPLGHSPTVDATNNVLYVAGFDRKLHALNAITGAQLWEYAEAIAGYDTNPIVVGGKVILGNRDGNMYAIGAHGTSQQGQLIWKYQTGGPIRFSPAYKNGIVYFASNDNYAYALNASNGSLVWKSQQQLSGNGFNSYWPVLFTDPATGQDYVVFASASGYRAFVQPGYLSLSCGGYLWCDWLDEFDGDVSGTLGPVVAVNKPWAQGKTVVDYSSVTQYLENNPTLDSHYHKPWRRYYFIYNAQTGQEYSMDTDGDGYREYTPVDPILSNSGNPYPPIVSNDGFLYIGNHYDSNGQSRLMGWRMGTPYFVITGIMSGAGDEPNAFSAGGNMLYRSICCDRQGQFVDNTDPSNNGTVWNYDLADRAPGYDQKWWFFDPTFLDRLGGNYGNVNGVYHNHGDQNPIVPYQGRLHIHRSNAVFAFGPGASSGKKALLTSNAVTQTLTTPSLAQLTTRLSGEIQKIVNAGHLRPGYYNAGQFNGVYNWLPDYFDNPGDTLYALSIAYPYLTGTLQQQTAAYLQNEYNTYFNPVMYASIGWAEGAPREAMPLPPEVTADLINYPKSQYADSNSWSWTYPQHNFYAMWRYAQNVVPQNALQIYNLAKSKLMVPAGGSSDFYQQQPWVHNAYIAGYTGFLALQQLAGMATADSALRASVTSELNRLQQLRVSAFSKDSYYTDQNLYQRRTLNVARNFMLLTPELGSYLNQNALTQMQAAINEYVSVAPYWFVSCYTASIGESTTQNLFDYPALFQAKAYILKETRAQLTKYLDVPAFARGDLFFIQNLVAAIQAP